jgi:hypothetical protein
VLLAKLNSKILLPQHLTRDQAQLVYKKENRARLEAEPLYITLGEVELPLEHIDRTKDVPNRWHTVKEVIERARTPEDWENVLLMVEGFRGAGLKFLPHWQKKVLRKMFEAKRADLVMRALERVQETKFSLKEQETREVVFLGLRNCAANEGWSKEGTTWALSTIERVIELMEHKLHLGKWAAAPGDPRANPFVIAYPLELAAMKVKKHLGGKDDGSVMKYATRTMAAFKQDDFMTTTLPATLEKLTFQPPEKPYQERGAVTDLRLTVYNFIPVWNGLQTASSVLGSKMPMADDAKKITKDVWKAIQRARNTLEEKKALGNVDEMIEKCKV